MAEKIVPKEGKSFNRAKTVYTVNLYIKLPLFTKQYFIHAFVFTYH
jgi:hypothetical protein